ncbi:hypothetical protein KC19_4G224900 [Ceratodon purpureus]|uniref:Transcription factor MYC/MYB N-terminal domain-containing protein n=1 Tax=Ceratodon purpureus TaxID=3225 RepID=A0A8T0IBI9_CERPU|nr:hypothetical protein KC19_4G224900 [Ceratodon purpureus]
MDFRSQLGVAPVMDPVLMQHTLRGLCSSDSQWVYAVFWRILPRNYPPPQWDTEGSIMDRSKGNRRNWYDSLNKRILVWEDGYCNFSACSATANNNGLSSPFFSVPKQHQHCSNDNQQVETMNPELFFKMSHDVYSYGEGLIGKIAADSSHKWVYQEPLENEIGFFSPWHGDIDPHPRTWEGHFKAGIQTIAVIAVESGVLQLGSTKKIKEDLNFVLYMQRKFNFLLSVNPAVFTPCPTSSGGAIVIGNEQPSSESVSAVAKNQADVLTTLNEQLHAARSNIDQFLFPNAAPDLWHPIVTPTAGKKRAKRSEPESSESRNSNQFSFLNAGNESSESRNSNQFSFLNAGNESSESRNSNQFSFLNAGNESSESRNSNQFSFLNAGNESSESRNSNQFSFLNAGNESSESRNSNQFSFLNAGNGFDLRTPEERQSPPKALHTELHSSPHAYIPSMSSLHNLLAKLPSVTGPLDTNNTGFSFLSNASFEATNMGGFHDFNTMQLPPISSDHSSDLQRLVDGECKVTSPTTHSSVDNSVSEDAELDPQNYKDTLPTDEKHTGFNSVFDSFGNFTEFGIQEALENGDSSYSSFLNEIC